MNSVLEYEPRLNETIEIFVDKLRQNFADANHVCDLDKWLLFCEQPLSEKLYLFFC